MTEILASISPVPLELKVALACGALVFLGYWLCRWDAKELGNGPRGSSEDESRSLPNTANKAVNASSGADSLTPTAFGIPLPTPDEIAAKQDELRKAMNKNAKRHKPVTRTKRRKR